jgi:hypothetical protein
MEEKSQEKERKYKGFREHENLEKLPINLLNLSTYPAQEIRFEKSKKYNTVNFVCFSFYKPISQTFTDLIESKNL